MPEMKKAAERPFDGKNRDRSEAANAFAKMHHFSAFDVTFCTTQAAQPLPALWCIRR
jgi:hypothetical protein